MIFKAKVFFLKVKRPFLKKRKPVSFHWHGLMLNYLDDVNAIVSGLPQL